MEAVREIAILAAGNWKTVFNLHKLLLKFKKAMKGWNLTAHQEDLIGEYISKSVLDLTGEERRLQSNNVSEMAFELVPKEIMHGITRLSLAQKEKIHEVLINISSELDKHEPRYSFVFENLESIWYSLNSHKPYEESVESYICWWLQKATNNYIIQDILSRDEAENIHTNTLATLIMRLKDKAF